jgi:hypothetical protein
MLPVFRESLLARVGALVGAIVLVGLFIMWSMMTPDGQQALLFRAVLLAGLFAPSIVIGAVMGWLTYSRRAWAYVTIIFAIVTVIVAGAFLFLVVSPDVRNTVFSLQAMTLPR